MRIDKRRRRPQRGSAGLTLTTHVLDTSLGLPAAGVDVVLYALEDERSATAGKRDAAVVERRKLVARAVTNDDGRTDAPLGGELRTGTYELVFSIGAYFERNGVDGFYREIPVRFTVVQPGKYHVPLLLSPWGYATYRGS